ncbi:Hsp20/alpha crystallin family protein [Zoogloea dura]|uniref:Hsp20/alpha crystallin family protein n=1 Tax=Zoogloea dura TaxID=2728840 RepID=A0A848GA62_9RHOO|nr:Hsp20/alpha crystallin family protein [Zoogloea dura]NML27785.1 Hsp20/alpha crystallin family protein [Zoogloea dura]
MTDVNSVRPQARAETSVRPEEVLLPPVDVIEDAAGITLFADLPGVSRDRLGVHIEGDSLTIEGRILLPAPEGLEPIHTEVGLAVYRRVFTLSKELDPDRVAAEFNQGVLKLRIPKVEHAQPRRIAVQVA